MYPRNFSRPRARGVEQLLQKFQRILCKSKLIIALHFEKRKRAQPGIGKDQT